MSDEPQQKNAPFLLSPVGKDSLWGGSRLKDEFNKDLPQDPLAESWECSTHPNGQSVIASGPFKGRTLSDVLLEHPEYIGTHPKAPPGQIPVLVKLIDASKDLSIQVHPTDEYAKEHENGQLGKTEMWYVLDAQPGAKLTYGFYHNISEKGLRKAIETNTLEKHMNRVEVRPNDIFFIEAGTIHGIGKGILVAEIQESSDLTYRLYDYGRLDKNGKPRELHIEKALEVVNKKKVEPPHQPMRVLKYKNGRATELLVRCKYFQVDRILINTERIREMAEFSTGSGTFQILLCYSGCGTLIGETGTVINLFKGDTVFVPANSESIKLHGKLSILRVRC